MYEHKQKQNKMGLTKQRKFATLREGVGIVGMRLDLNLSQCQALNFHYHEFVKLSENCDNSDTLKSSMSALIPFLSLFKDIQNPMDPNLWVNENLEQ